MDGKEYVGIGRIRCKCVVFFIWLMMKYFFQFVGFWSFVGYEIIVKFDVEWWIICVVICWCNGKVFGYCIVDKKYI